LRCNAMYQFEAGRFGIF